MEEPKTPIILNEHGDVEVFDSIARAELEMEAHDVRNAEYTAFDAEGLVLIPTVQADGIHVKLVPSEDREYRSAELTTLLRTFLSRVGVELTGLEEDQIWRLELAALVAQMKRLNERPRRYQSGAVALTIGTLLALMFSTCTWASHDMENCTMGDTDGYFLGLIYGTPLAFGAVFCLWRGRRAGGWRRYLPVILVGSAEVVLCTILVPWVLSATVTGHHPCGPEYDNYIPYGRAVDRFVPGIYLLLLALVVAAAAVPALRGAQDDQAR